MQFMDFRVTMTWSHKPQDMFWAVSHTQPITKRMGGARGLGAKPGEQGEEWGLDSYPRTPEVYSNMNISQVAMQAQLAATVFKH